MMERKGIYRKGSAGHARNIASYRVYREKIKKWRIPLTGLLALALVLTSVPSTGEKFQASVLTQEQAFGLSSFQPAQIRKIILNTLKSFIDDCKKYFMDQCVDEGRVLVRQLIAGEEKDVFSFVQPSENFFRRYERAIEDNRYKYR